MSLNQAGRVGRCIAPNPCGLLDVLAGFTLGFPAGRVVHKQLGSNYMVDRILDFVRVLSIYVVGSLYLGGIMCKIKYVI